MKTCSTCRFFGSLMPVIGAYDDGNCDASETAHHACARIIHGNADMGLPYSKLRDELAVVTDGSGYAARLKVLPDFGCVLHQEASLANSSQLEFGN